MINSERLIHNLYTHGFHMVDAFLEPMQCQLIYEKAQEMYLQKLYREAKIGPHLSSHKNNRIRTDEIFWLNEQETTSEIQIYLKQIQHLVQLINYEFFLGLYEFEVHFARYQPGSYYKKHVDQFATQKNRKISCVYYLNKDWQPEFGGELKIYNKEDQLIQVIVPQENRFVCFNSELPHEVCLTHQPRYSITGWMKTRPDLF